MKPGIMSEDMDRIVAMRAEGMLAAEISQRLQIVETAVSDYLASDPAGIVATVERQSREDGQPAMVNFRGQRNTLGHSGLRVVFQALGSEHEAVTRGGGTLYQAVAQLANEIESKAPGIRTAVNPRLADDVSLSIRTAQDYQDTVSISAVSAVVLS